uniref:Phosphatidylinositol 4-phosphate 3-kinase C2 domain-containing subunit alpha n=1 Tax=Oryzias sinensis TaxID=183150 RepID=A0A8C7YLA2_9TELE
MLTISAVTAGDPWDAVLESKGNTSRGSPPPEAKVSLAVHSQHRRASTGASVTRSHSLNISETSSQHKPSNQDKRKEKALKTNGAQDEEDAQNLEIAAFCKDVATLRSKFPNDDISTNPGFVLSPVIAQRGDGGDNSNSVKVSIEISGSREPVTFTCDGNSPVELLISQTLCWVHDDLNQVDFSSYLLKVCGREEVLKHSLGSHEYVQNCRKWENEITLQLLSHSTMRRDLARTVSHFNKLGHKLLMVASRQHSAFPRQKHNQCLFCCFSYEKYFLMCSLTHNGKNLFKPVQSKRVVNLFVADISPFSLRISFPIAIAVLPLESILSLTLFGVLNQNASGSPDSNKQRKAPELLGKDGTSECLDNVILFDLLSLFSRLKQSDHQLLWDYRLHCRRDHPSSLPKVLASAPSWDWASMAHIHSLLHHWPSLPPVAALELLDSKFADTEVRSVAVSWIEKSSDDELADYLPQLVQALKFECHLNNALVKFLLSRAQGNINIAHYLYWLLKDAVQDPVWGQRYERVLGALLCLCGSKLRAELEKQTHLVTLLGAVAERVKQAGGSARQVALQEGLENVQNFFQRNSCRLPLSPSLVAKELNIKACSFFSSNAVPLKLALVNADPLGEEINVMYKVGEDLRQDMLALQMIRIMDRMWLQEGLDLRIVNFKCISTGKDKGMVELVPSSDTLRKIQVEYGVTGSFKDKPLAEWLRKYNPAEDEYEKASENFIYSCAGCCVATYVLGICDRHNDNIMLRSTGHMFHIDFGKFLGHAQMFGSFKRDRAPFVLTSDMAYVINGGERPTSRFQLFVDLCCQAYNLIRKHCGLFLNLLSLMMSSGLPELSGSEDLKYVFDALQPHSTDAEATIFFTRLIESSLGSVATKFNFFIHNLAQLRFSGLPANDEPILSFSPKTYTMKQEGRILHASIFSFQKRYNPDKYYTYVVRILREGQNEPQFVFRTFDEFQELHNKLTILFPLWKLPSFPNKMVLGRTHIKEVAAKRKVELSHYVHNLMRSSTEVIQCDLIYTFFHPIARDDRAEGLDATPKPPMSPNSGRVEGEVKLSISYRNSTLFIMVMHIKDLVSEDGTDPNPYVKTYLLPDPHKTSKRKTKISRKTRNPTFNEMLVYSGYSKETLGLRELQLSVLSAESLSENYFLGSITLRLKDFDLSKETVKWYKLTAVPYF